MPPDADAPAADVAPAVLRARGGDAAAFAGLYRRFAPVVHGVLLARLRPAEADEATHEALVLAHRRLGQLRDPAAFGPWVVAIARNVAHDRLRARRRERLEALPDPDGIAAAASAGGNGDGAGGELRERVLVHLQSLPEAYRETLALRLVEGLGGPEIAAATGLAPGSVRVNLCRGMEMLRELLRKEGWP